MVITYIKYICLAVVFFLLNKPLTSQSDIQKAQAELAMRMIGHEILLIAEDSTSRVMPIEKDDNKYKISFDTEFRLDPDRMIPKIDSIVLLSGIATHYLIEFQNCTSSEVIYSYELNTEVKSDMQACRSRIQPYGCYNLLFSILKGTQSDVPALKERPYSNSVLVIFPMLILLGSVGYFSIRKNNTDEIKLGTYIFDKKHLKLQNGKNITDLSSKEADLLYLLYSSANNTLERDEILRVVWGNNGDYVGRTLDVFISKLRKKLEEDPSIKIINIRGIGYKLIVGEY